MSIIGNRYECQCCSRIATIVDEYDDEGNGYIYRFEGVEGQRWISTASFAIRFRRIGASAEEVKEALKASQEN